MCIRDRSGNKQSFSAKITGSKKYDKEEAQEIERVLSNSAFAVSKIATRESKSRPPAPFTTSTLQQESSRSLRFQVSRTMRVAQQLYEGISIGSEGETGLITYMRTDSTNISSVAVREITKFIEDTYGEKYVGSGTRARRRKVAVAAQEAHEAIRPTSVSRTPDSLKSYLQPDEHRLYQLIWRRMVASQMSDSIYDRTVIDIKVEECDTGSEYGFRAAGSVLKFDGFRILYTERVDDQEEDNDEDQGLPQLDINQSLILSTINPEQNFTQPPPRFTEASLIRNLEKEGIGRPSTYATIMGTIQDRDYVISERGRFQPTILGNVVTDYLVDNFEKIMDIGFTSNMEKGLDEVAY